MDVKCKIYPSQFEIDLPMQHCNIGGENPSEKNPACIMCERHTGFSRQEDRLNEFLPKLRPYMRYLQCVHIQGIAEPFWKERIFEICDLLNMNQHSHKVVVSTTTNGTLMTPERRARFLKFPLSCITWSLDASSPEIYQQIRRVNMYDKIAEYLKAYAKERSNPATQQIRIHNNINMLNINDVEGMVELAAEVGVDCLDFNATYGPPGFCVNQENLSFFREAQMKILILSQKLGVHTTFLRDLVLDFEKPPELVELSTDLS